MIWIILGIIVSIILYIWLKPYFIRYTNTLAISGEMGTGKTYTAVDVAVKVLKRRKFCKKIKNWFKKQYNKIVKHHNNKIATKAIKNKKNPKPWKLKEYEEMPKLVSNIPIRIKGGKNPEWSYVLEKEMLTFEKVSGEIIKLSEDSILLIDELPQLVDQFNWNIPEVQNNLNEAITFIRHYFNGFLIVTAQAEDQVVKPIRQKMSTYYYLMNWRKFLFKFYKVDVIQFMSSELVTNVTEGFIEDNTKTVYGILHKSRYESRCYAPRYQDLPENKNYKFKKWHKYTTKRIIRFDNYKSPLDKQVNKE